jgi:RNA polymerase sigma-70 factor, ECF subfamily
VAVKFASLEAVMSLAPDPETVLMLRVKQQGDLSAFEELVERYKQPIVNLVGRTLGDAIEAEDLAQMVFVQVFKSAHRYQPSARFSTWIYTIARNLCLNELRRRSRHPAEPLDAPTPEAETQHTPRQFEDPRTTSPPDSLLQLELQQKIEEALQALPENQRTAILLCREQDLSYEEIAAILGITLSATKSLIHRGRETLKQKLKPYIRTGVWLDPSPSSKTEKQL